MSRLTTRMSIMGRKHDIEGGQAHHWKKLLKNYDYPLIEEVVDKLGELEDIEDELGCPLETIFKALTQGVYAKYTVVWEPEVKKEVGKFSVCLVRNIFGLKGWFIMAGRKEIYFWGLNEHGKTWALTKEELER